MGIYFDSHSPPIRYCRSCCRSLSFSVTPSQFSATECLDYNALARADYSALKGATIVVAIIPILILYPFVLRFYANDVLSGGIKE
jgi:ABC-type glycerol-3-phosphate transport system permease component